jgi:TPP-dependent pyruvate/acetoin dehydrogenase alpha subunit
MAEQLRRSANLSVVFIGDGTFGEGIVYETLNIAALWKLPLFVVVENNGWAQSTPIATNMAGELADRFRPFGVPVRQLTTTDVVDISLAAEEEIGLARQRSGPRALVLNTYRLCHHSKNDDDRPKAEVEARWTTEPLRVHAPRLDEAVRVRIDREIDEALADTVARAKGSS